MQSRSLGILAIIIVLALGAFAVFSHPALSATPSCKDCSVIVIGVDTLRADELHTLGYERETTPTLDKLASRGVIFSQAISASNWTVPSFMSIFTGLYPSVHEVTNKYTVFTKTTQTITNLKQLSPDVETLAEAMKHAGYATGGFTGDAGVSHAFGYSQGFDVYTDETKFGGLANSETHALSWLDGLPKGQKFFMFFHGYDLHGQFALPKDVGAEFVPTDYTGPYTGSPQEEARLREQQLQPGGITLTSQDAAFWRGVYDSKVKDADSSLAGFISELEKRGLLDKTVIVVVSDHGEEYYEHGGIDHGQSLYDELVHVPLIIDVPGMKGGTKVTAQVSMMDVAPTIFDILGLQPDATYAKQISSRTSLIPLISGKMAAGSDVFTETDYRNALHERSVRTADGWKYILNLASRKEELYNLIQDPGEKDDLAASEPDKKDVLRRELLAHMRDDLDETLDMPVNDACLPVYDGECL